MLRIFPSTRQCGDQASLPPYRLHLSLLSLTFQNVVRPINVLTMSAAVRQYDHPTKEAN